MISLATVGRVGQASFRHYRLNSLASATLTFTTFSASNCHSFIGSRYRKIHHCIQYLIITSPLRHLYSPIREYSVMSPAPVAKNGTHKAVHRLPKSVVPTNYDLTFEPDWTNHTYRATAQSDVEVREATSVIVLNACKFNVDSVSYTTEGCSPALPAKDFILDANLERLTINFPSALAVGKGRLKIEYSGQVADNLKGLFRSKYQGPNGEDRYHYLTKFEPTFARGCFPCWDEPAIKTTYDITLIVPKHLVAVSNMPVKADVPHPTNPDKKVVSFERSVKMSTYVMAFAVGEFDYVEQSTPDGILCRVYTPVGKRERGNFALEVVIKSLAFYKDYFGIPYPLPKMDLLGCAEFGSGAMENFGLVIFREQNLLLDLKLSSSITKQYVAIVVAHETAHMWFGNLVTMEWWSDLWLNEGFATWMEFECVNTIYPEFQIWNLFMSDFTHALELDASATSHPIQATVEDPAEIGAIFDMISYSKGASVIRMIHNYIGDCHFREGMKHYLTQHLFGNAETKDLWAALTEKSGKKIDVIMPTFTEQMGYPVISVKNVKQIGNQKQLTLSYEKYWADSTARADCTNNYKWIIPVTVRNQSEPAGVALSTLINQQAGAEFNICVDSNENEWVKLNADHVGYYRVTYTPIVLEQFKDAIESKQMQPLDRLGLLDDLFANAKAGHINSDRVLEFIAAYKNEDMYSVWAGIIKVISSLDKLLDGTTLHGSFKQYARSLLIPIAAKLGWDPKENESSQDAVLRTSILTRLVALGDVDTLEEARSRFRKHIRGELTISPDVRSSVYRAVASQDEAGFEALLKIYRSTDLLEEKVRILGALAATKDKELVQRLLEFGRSSEVNMQDIATILVSLSDQGKLDIAWDYFRNNWEFFRDSLPTGGFIIRRVVNGVTSDFKTDQKAVEVEKFFAEHHIKGIERTVSQSLESIRINKAWLERDTSGLQEFLSPYV